jgi:hypothetical protein
MLAVAVAHAVGTSCDVPIADRDLGIQLGQPLDLASCSALSLGLFRMHLGGLRVASGLHRNTQLTAFLTDQS